MARIATLPLPGLAVRLVYPAGNYGFKTKRHVSYRSPPTAFLPSRWVSLKALPGAGYPDHWRAMLDVLGQSAALVMAEGSIANEPLYLYH